MHPKTAIGLFSNSFLNPKNEITNAVMGDNTFAWTLDPIGNRISDTDTISSVTHDYTANSLNQYTQITNGGLVQLAYDLDGNLTNDGHFAYTWDAENRLTSVISNGTVIASFKYDYMSRRYEKATAAGTNTFLWDGWLPVCEFSDPTTGNSATNFFVWGLDLSQSLQGAGGIGGLLSVTKSDGTYFPLADANGNITDYVTADGDMVAHREYDAYGNTIVASGAVDDFQFWFSSKYLDQETGLYYFGYRLYSPMLGRWLSRDPIEEVGDRNLYLWMGNCSINRRDPFGASWEIDGPYRDDPPPNLPVTPDGTMVGLTSAKWVGQYDVQPCPGSSLFRLFESWAPKLTITWWAEEGIYHPSNNPSYTFTYAQHELSHVADWKSEWLKTKSKIDAVDLDKCICESDARCKLGRVHFYWMAGLAMGMLDVAAYDKISYNTSDYEQKVRAAWAIYDDGFDIMWSHCHGSP